MIILYYNIKKNTLNLLQMTKSKIVLCLVYFAH